MGYAWQANKEPKVAREYTKPRPADLVSLALLAELVDRPREFGAAWQLTLAARGEILSLETA